MGLTIIITKLTGRNRKQKKLLVTDGVEGDQDIGTQIYLRGKCSVTADDRNKKLLLKKRRNSNLSHRNTAKGQRSGFEREKLGRIAYYLNGKLIDSYPGLCGEIGGEDQP